MHGSVVVVQIREARELPDNISSYAEVTFANQRYSTQVKPSNSQPVWNEKFTFDVVTGREVIGIQVYDSAFAGLRAIGSCEYELSKLLPPEFTFDDWLPLLGPDNKQVVAQAKVCFQWIKSRVLFFENLIGKIEAQLNDYTNELGYHEGLLTSLYGRGVAETWVAPFGFLAMPLLPRTVPQKSPGQPSPMPKSPTREPVEIIGQVQVLERRVKGRVDTFAPEVARVLGLGKQNWHDLSGIGSLIYLALSGLMLFARPNLVDMVIASMCFYATMIDRKMLEQKFTYLLIFLVLSLLSDMMWLAFCASVLLSPSSRILLMELITTPETRTYSVT